MELALFLPSQLRIVSVEFSEKGLKVRRRRLNIFRTSMDARSCDETLQLLDQLSDRNFISPKEFQIRSRIKSLHEPVVISQNHLQRLAQVVTCHRQKYRTKGVIPLDVLSPLFMAGPRFDRSQSRLTSSAFVRRPWSLNLPWRKERQSALFNGCNP